MQTTYLGKEAIAEGTMLFRFTKPDQFSFRAGQSIDLTLLNPPETDAEGNTRAYSLCSAPHESELRVAMRMRDTAFKRVLKEMSPGTEAKLDGPFGSFFLHEDTRRPAVFLAGGIGVTPFRSMVLDALHRNLSHTIYLFYSNRRPEDAAFLAEFQSLQSSKFICVPTMTNAGESAEAWQGETGYITAAMLEKYIPSDAVPIYYLAGPLAMVTAMRTLLQGTGVSSDDIRFEEFLGY